MASPFFRRSPDPMNELQPLLNLLGGKAGWLTTLITWLGVLAPLSALCGTKFKHWISDKLNAVAASEDLDDDAYLTKLFSLAPWRLAAFLSKFTPFHLPTLADLERAIRLQHEAAIDAGASLPAQRTASASRNPILPIFLAAIFLSAALSGCGTLDKSGVYAGDQALYRAELAVTTSYNVIHTFVKWEHENRAALAQWPEIKQAAKTMRAHAEEWFHTANALHDAYVASPTSTNRESFLAAVSILRTALTEATGYMAKAATQPTN